MIKKYLLLILMLSRLSTGIAQPEKLCFEHLNVRNGLPSDYVGQILQDERGYIWLNTSSSLSRYDGYKFRNYKYVKRDENDLIEGIFLDRNKILWVGTRHGSLFRFDPASDTLVPERYLQGNVKNIFFFKFFNDGQNKVWAFGFEENEKAIYLEQYDAGNKKSRKFSATQKGGEFLDTGILNTFPFVTRSGDIFFGTGNGLYEYNFKTNNFEPYLNSPDSLHSFYIADLSENKQDTSGLWLLAKHPNEKMFTLYLFNRHDKTLKACASIRGTVNRSAKALFEDRKGRLWLVVKEGLYLYSRHTNDTTEYLFPRSDKFVKEQFIGQIMDDTEGNLWFQTQLGVLYFNTSDGKFQRYMANPSDPDALAHNHVTNIFEDASGLMWVGMDEYGVDRINKLRSSFRTLKYDPSQPGSYPENATGISQTVDGNYWVTSQRGLFEWDTRKDYFRKMHPGSKDENNWTGDPISLKNGGLYYNVQSGLTFFSRAGKLESFRLPGDNNISRLFTSSDEAIWVLSGKGKLYQFDPSGHSFGLYTLVDISGKNAITDTLGDITSSAFYEDRQGVLWMSTAKAGLCRIDRAKRTIISSPSLQGEVFKNTRQMYEDSKGNFWLCTDQKGLWLFDRKTGKLVKQIVDKDGLLSEWIGGITEDRDGNLWVFSEKGLTKFNHKNNSSFSYTVANRIPFDAPVSMTKTKSGEFLLCMFNSAMLFNPDEIKPNHIAPVVQIESIAYSNPQSKQPDEQMINTANTTNFSLSYKDNRVTFNFVALHYVNSLQNQYAYKLDGVDKNWVQAGNEHKVTYNNLDPGTYTFHVKAANSDGVWSTKDEFITVIITPPWWETWWFRILSVIAMIAVVRAIVQQHSRNLKKQNIMLEEKVIERTKELKHSLEELKSTQQQLIHQEKMASLGELTAGIAHEIQNPLNFVNNFSEVNKELVDELQQQLKAGKMDDAMAISNDIKDNEEKINHHGNRADAIVKGMLQHTRKSTGQKEPTDLNALADEYLRLAYHGMRARDKNFNVTLQTDFDSSISKINIVPQDIGRVFLNLVNNAFYAINEKKKTANEVYQPTVAVQTKRLNNNVEIIVKDNGNGIPQNIVNKIFQPFFTTKPTGQGTGLGLSLAYDIIKAHGGEIKVESKEGEGSALIIQLPLKKES